MSTQPEQEPTNSEILAKLTEIEKELKKVKKQLDSNSWIWFGIIVGGAIGWWLGGLSGC